MGSRRAAARPGRRRHVPTEDNCSTRDLSRGRHGAAARPAAQASPRTPNAARRRLRAVQDSIRTAGFYEMTEWGPHKRAGSKLVSSAVTRGKSPPDSLCAAGGVQAGRRGRHACCRRRVRHRRAGVVARPVCGRRIIAPTERASSAPTSAASARWAARRPVRTRPLRRDAHALDASTVLRNLLGRTRDAPRERITWRETRAWRLSSSVVVRPAQQAAIAADPCIFCRRQYAVLRPRGRASSSGASCWRSTRVHGAARRVVGQWRGYGRAPSFVRRTGENRARRSALAAQPAAASRPRGRGRRRRDAVKAAAAGLNRRYHQERHGAGA